MDDDMTDTRPVPEAVGDYLGRMVEQAVRCYTDLPASSMVGGDDDG